MPKPFKPSKKDLEAVLPKTAEPVEPEPVDKRGRYVKLQGVPLGKKDWLTMELRDVRKEAIAVFRRLGGGETLARFAAESRGHYRFYIEKILLPLLPSRVDEEAIGQDNNRDAAQYTFDREAWARYAKKAGIDDGGRDSSESARDVG